LRYFCFNADEIFTSQRLPLKSASDVINQYRASLFAPKAALYFYSPDDQRNKQGNNSERGEIHQDKMHAGVESKRE
jgi:hypothetical protein